MLADLDYLKWAHRLYPRIERFDLASSGTPVADASLLGDVAISDWQRWYEFRDRIAAKHGLEAATEALPTLGVSQALWLTCAAVLEPGDEVIVETPTYEPMVRVPEGHGAVLKHIARRIERDYDPDPDEFIAAMNERTKLVLLTSPHNPSGHPVSDQTLTKLHDACAERDIWLFVDEVYAGFLPGPRRAARNLGARALSASSLTKHWGLGWARAGWLLGPTEFLETEIAPAIRHSTGMTGSPHTAIGVAALDAEDALNARATAAAGEGAARVDAWVDEHERLSWKAPPAGLHGWVRAEGDIDVRPLIEHAAEAHGLIVAPGEFFGDERSAFRIGWTLEDAAIDEALALLGEVLGL